MRRRLSIAPWMLSAFMLCTACDCDNRSEQTGETGEFIFSYVSADRDEDFDRPMALESQLVMRITDSDTEEVAQQITQLKSLPSEHFALSSSGQQRGEFLLTGQRSGRGSVEVVARSNGQTKTDRISVEVAPVTRQRLEHLCTSLSEAAYLPNRTIELGFERYHGSRRLVGRGSCGATFDPPVVEGISCDEANFKLQGVEQAGPISVSSGSGLSNFKIHVVSPELVDFAPVGTTNPLYEGQSEGIRLEPQTMYWPVCATMRLDVEIITTRICRTSSGETSFSVDHRPGVDDFRLQGHLSGDCVFRVSSPDLARPDQWEFAVPVYAR